MREFFGGFGAIASDRKLALIVTLYGIQTFVAGSLNVLIVVAALELLDLGQAGVGFLNSAVGIGGLLGAVAAFALVGRQRLASDFAFGLLLWGIPIALIGIFPRPPVALILLAIVGVGNTVVDVAALTLLQRTVPDEVLTRVFGVIQSVFIGTVGLGAIFAPLMINAVGIRWALILTGALLPVSAGLTWRRITSLDADVVAPTKEIALLRTIPLFRPLPATTIDEPCVEPDPGPGRPREPRSSARATPATASTSSTPARSTCRSTGSTWGRWARATTSARSRSSATCRAPRRSPPGARSASARSSATSS